MKIERSIGLATGYALAPLCGNGYEGATDELDSLVQRAAEMLAAEFSRDIEIRFNSDRRSGGAWLKNALLGYAGNCQVQLGAGLCKKAPHGVDVLSFSRYEYAQLPDRIYICTYVAESALRDKSLATEGQLSSQKGGYSWLEHDSLEVGLAWLCVNVDREGIAS
jgi:hypothetical protein